MNIFCISGLGADERIFKYIDFGSHSITHIPWLIPEQSESIESYSSRMGKNIGADKPVLLGVSFGGMIAIEISKLLDVQKIILISSIKTEKEKPFYFRAAAILRINKIFPMKPHRMLEPIENYNLGIKTTEQKNLAREYREHLNIQYSNWAIDQCLNWKNMYVPKNLIHLHGSKDHVLPLKYIKPDHIIQGGGHLMVMNKAEQINKILAQSIN